MCKFRDYNKYEVFEDGRIWSYSHKKWLKPKTNKNGYKEVVLTDNKGKRKTYYVHRIVYQAVTGEPIPEGLQVNHINECKTDNRFENLNLMTLKENLNWGSARERSIKSQSKQVGAFKDGKLIMTFSSTNEAGRNGFDQSAVAKCCKNCYNKEGNNLYKGFEWRYL